MDPAPRPRRRPRHRRTETAPLLLVPHRRPPHHHRPTTHLPPLQHLALDRRPRRRVHTRPHPPTADLTARPAVSPAPAHRRHRAGHHQHLHSPDPPRPHTPRRHQTEPSTAQSPQQPDPQRPTEQPGLVTPVVVAELDSGRTGPDARGLSEVHIALERRRPSTSCGATRAQTRTYRTGVRRQCLWYQLSPATAGRRAPHDSQKPSWASGACMPQEHLVRAAAGRPPPPTPGVEMPTW